MVGTFGNRPHNANFLSSYYRKRRQADKKVFAKKMNNGNDSSDYIRRFMEIMGNGSGIDFSFISKESMKNQFCTDLYTKVGEHIQVSGTTIHFFMH